ncbi:ABC transporter ATP-binding protein [Nocardia sp. SYP-A9097]|uniref:ATP-binding cassette domain-containing protein n=1 Tax=Nocardia sp. SYP-A9097 TaxID=2663237 RepID=UPI0018913CAE|nr:ABC transporter ATP-binding protein [Nocardia sp. SYP-A9097]
MTIGIPDSGALLRVSDLGVRLSGHTDLVVSGVSFTLSGGECVALVGESGSGKTMVASALSGLLPEGGVIATGTAHLGDIELTALAERDWRSVRGRRIGVVPQDALGALDPLRPAGWEVAEAMAVHRIGSRRERRARVYDAMERAGIDDAPRRARQRSPVLSGGLRQRVLIAGALSAAPQLVIADEPTTALDAVTQRRIIAELNRIRRGGTAVLLISHDLELVAEVADRVLVLRDGRVVESGPARRLMSAPADRYTRLLVDSRVRGSRLGAVPPVPAGAEVLSVSGVGCVLQRRRVLSEVSATIRRGRTLGVVGASGSGKSTLASLILGLRRPTEGEIRIEGRPWSAEPERRRRARRPAVQFVAQDSLGSFRPGHTVGEVVAESLVPLLRRGDIGRSAIDPRVRAVLDQVGLPRTALTADPRALSGGQRQRVNIARALAPSPRLLIADEPVSALDVVVQDSILRLLAEIQADTGLAMLLISHDLSVVRDLAHETLILEAGRVAEYGPTPTILDHPTSNAGRELKAALPPDRRAYEMRKD